MNTEKEFDPDQLLTRTSVSYLAPAIMISIIAHIVVIGLTSFGLYRDWGEFGISCDEHSFHTPSIINAHRTQAQKAAEEAARKEKLEKEADERAKKDAAAAEAAENKKANSAADAPAAAPAAGDKKPAAQEQQVKPPEVEPMAPAKVGEFDLDI